MSGVLCHLIKNDGELEVPEFVLHVHVVDTELSTDLNLYSKTTFMTFPFCIVSRGETMLFVTELENTFQRQALSLLY